MITSVRIAARFYSLIHAVKSAEPFSRRNECERVTMKRYVVGWKSQLNGRIGKSNTPMPYEEAERLALELNNTYTIYLHVPVPAETKLEDLADILGRAEAKLPKDKPVEPGSEETDQTIKPEEPAALSQ